MPLMINNNYNPPTASFNIFMKDIEIIKKTRQAIGEGRSLHNVTSEMNMVAEGIDTAKSVHQLRLKHNVEMPIHEAIYQVLFENKNPRSSVVELMNRRLSEENN